MCWRMAEAKRRHGRVRRGMGGGLCACKSAIGGMDEAVEASHARAADGVA